MNPDSKELEVPTMQGNTIVKAGERITEDKGGFFIVGEPKMNREQRRHSLKHDERLIVKAITIDFENGTAINLDPARVMIVDKDTKAQLFNYVIEGS